MGMRSLGRAFSSKDEILKEETELRTYDHIGEPDNLYWKLKTVDIKIVGNAFSVNLFAPMLEKLPAYLPALQELRAYSAVLEQAKRRAKRKALRTGNLEFIGDDIRKPPLPVNVRLFEGFLNIQDEEPQLLMARFDYLNYRPENESKSESAYDALSRRKFYLYRGYLYQFDESDIHSIDEQKLLIQADYLKRDRKFNKIIREVELFNKLSSKLVEPREPIPEDVRFAIWRRDEGKCVLCGSNQNLEFDHIIPVSKGGSKTERNIQLLCEKCNREKSAKI